MTSHEQRLHILADALLIEDPKHVVAALRSRDVMYLGPRGAVLFATGPDWSDERLVEAAVELFVVADASEPPVAHAAK